jgi:membrane-associated phospholipid phosphatase
VQLVGLRLPTSAAARARRGTPSPGDGRPAEPPTRYSIAAGPLVAGITLVTALLAAREAGLPFQDPKYAVAHRFALVAVVVVVLAVLDIVVRAASRSWTLRPSLAALQSVRRERWPWRRAAAVGSVLVSFYVTYLAYRNLKSILPLLRPGELFDRQLASFDRGLLGGNDPAGLLHGMLGTGVAAQILSVVYYAFFYFVPISLVLALVFSPAPQAGIRYGVALTIDWALGAGSYYLLPALGPIYATPARFAGLPTTASTHLQDVLIRQRFGFLVDPAAPDAHQGIAAFSSLHTAIIFTAAAAAQMLPLPRWLRIGLWSLFGLTAVATIYLGWHYVADDIAGVVIAVIALAVAGRLTRFEMRTLGRRIPKPGVALPVPAPDPGHQIAATRALEVAETTSGSDIS